MATDIDSLQIQINVQATKANNALDRLVKNLDRLTTSLSSIDGNKLNVLASGVQSLSNAMQAMNKVKTSDFTRFVKKLSILNDIDGSKLSGVSEKINEIGTAVSGLSGSSQEIAQITELASSLGSLNGTKVKGLDSVQKQAKDATKAMQPLTEKYKDLGKDFKFFGGYQAAQKKIESLSNAFETARMKKESLEASGEIGGKMYDKAVRDFSMLGNQIENVKKQLEDPRTPKPVENFETHGLEEYKEEMSEVSEKTKSVIVSTSSLKYDAEAMKMVFGEMADGIETYNQAIEKYGNQAGMILNGAFGSNMGTTELSSAAEKAKQLGELLSKLVVPEVREENLTKLDSAISKTEQKLDSLRTKLANGLTMGTISESVDDSGYVRLREQIALTKKSLEELQAKRAEVESTSGGNGLEKTEKKIRNVGTAAKYTSPRLSDMSRRMRGLTSSFSGGLKSLLKYTVGIRSLYVLFNKLRNGLKEGMKNLVQFSSETNTSVSLLYNSLNQLKNASAAAVSPLLNAVAPALNQIIQLFVNAANAVNQFLAALTGKSTWVKAKVLTDDYAASLESANKAAKNLTTLGIDELNINSGDTSSGSSGTSAGDMFEYEEVSQKWKDFADWFKSMWKDADFTELGEKIGEMLTNALNSIPWETVYEGARNFGKGLATFLNGLISPELFGAVGRTIAGALNTAIYAALSFGETFDWVNFGESIAEGINEFFATFDFADLANTINVWTKGILNSIIVALENIEWKEIGKKIGELLEKIDFLEIGKKIVILIWDAIKAAWDLITGSFSEDPIATALLGILTLPAIVGFGSKIIGFVVTPFINAFNTIQTIFAQFSTFIAPILEKVTEMFALWSGGAGTLSESFMAVFGAGGVIAIALAALAVGLGVVYAKNEEVRESFANATNAIKEGFQPAIEFITDTLLPDLQAGWERLKEIISPFTDFLNDAFVSIWQEMINPALTYVGETVLPLLTSAIENLWNNVLVPFGNFLMSVLEPAIQIISDILRILWENVVVPLADAIGNVLGKAFDGLIAIFNETVVPIVNVVIEVFQFLWNNVFSPIVDFLWDKFKPVFENVFNIIKGLIEGLGTAFGGLIDFITGVFTLNWKKAWNGVKDIFKGIFNGLISIAEGVINHIINGINIFLDGFNGIVAKVGAVIGIDIEIPSIPTVAIPRFETGGFPEDGLFFANHNELVGQFSNGKTAVANNEQITEGIKQGVKEAVSEILAPYLSEIAKNTRETADKDFDISLDGRSLLDGLKQRSSRSGYSFT